MVVLDKVIIITGVTVGLAIGAMILKPVVTAMIVFYLLVTGWFG